MARERPEWMDGKIRKVKMPCGTLYIAISHDTRGYPREVFLMGSKFGTCRANLEANARQASSQLWDSKFDQLIDDLTGIRCHACERKKGSMTAEEKQIYPSSCPDCAARSLIAFREMMREKK